MTQERAYRPQDDEEPAPEPGSAPAAQIGARVRSRREAAGWSMRELAGRVGVSQPFISKLESGRLLPSVSTLYALAAALGTRPSELLPPVAEESRTALHIPLRDDRDSVSIQLIAGGPGQSIQAYLFELGAGESDQDVFQHGGEEVVYVLEGVVRCEREDRPPALVEAGSSLTIDPTVPHSWRNASREPVRFLMICADFV